MTRIHNLAALFVIIFSASFFISCQRELDSPGTGAGTGTTGEKVNASVRGTVIDDNNQPVAGATVTSGTSTTTTNNYGVFEFKNISLLKSNGSVKVEKAGFFKAIKSFVTTAGRTHHVRIHLITKNISGSFIASTGGTVTLSSGAKLVIPATAITDASGNPYTGNVNIAMTWIDPSSANLPELVPGDLRGINTTGQEMGLQTFGMIGVEMTGSGNQTLKIAAGKTAELTFPVPASMLSAAPATIDLWHFDEASAQWKQEGSATKTGNNYVATVSHFSFWNCDAPFPLINLCMTIVNAANNQPMNNVQVRIQRPNGSYGYGWTDGEGNLCGKVPKNEPLVLQVMDQCNTVAVSQNIGPFTTDTNLGNISVNLAATNSLVITGTITNCAAANVTNGAAIIYTNGSFSYTVPVTNGSFSLTVIRCSASPLNFSVMGIDYAALQQSVPVTGTGTTGTVNAGTIQACGTSSIQFVQYIIDGTVYGFANPPDGFFYTDSTGLPGPNTMRSSYMVNQGSQGVGSFSSMTFAHNGSIGTYPITNFYFGWLGTLTTTQFVNANPVVNITNMGPVPGGFLEGNFNELMIFNGSPKNVLGTFKVRRN